MRGLHPGFGAFLALVVATQAGAVGRECHSAELAVSAQRVRMLERVRAADANALRLTSEEVGCFAEAEYDDVMLATASYFDAKPREFIEVVAKTKGGFARLLDAVTILPVSVRDDLRGQLPILEKRIAALDENADLLGDSALGRAVVQVQASLEHAQSFLYDSLPEPETARHPLFGIDVTLRGGRWEPIPIGFLDLETDARGLYRRQFISYWDNHDTIYSIVGGMELLYESGAIRPSSLRPEIPWVQVVDDRGQRMSVRHLGPASEFFTNPEIPAKVREGMCVRLVESVDNFFLRRQEFQAALDARIAQEPNAGLARPLKLGLKAAGYDVRRYRELPGLGGCKSKR